MPERADKIRAQRAESRAPRSARRVLVELRMAKKIEDLPIHSHVERFWSAINAILDLPAVRKDSDLYDEISRANESVPSNMVEGFEQGTDRAFAHFLRYSKGSIAEIRKRLRKAYYRRYITREELDARLAQGEALEEDAWRLHQVPGTV